MAPARILVLSATAIVLAAMIACDSIIGPQGPDVTISNLRRYEDKDGDWLYFDVKSHKDIEGSLEIRAEFRTPSGTIHESTFATGIKGALSPDELMSPGRQWSSVKLEAYDSRLLEKDTKLDCEGCGRHNRENLPVKD